MPGDIPSRRDFLSLLGASGIIGLSGCSEAVEDSTSTSELADSGSGTTSPSPTPTPIDDKAPSIIEYEALPEDYGTKLNVLLRGEDNRAIAYAAISYGDRILDAEPEEAEVKLDGVLEDIPDAEPTFPGQVVYTLRDAAGTETEEVVYADEKAPSLSLETRITKNSGELELLLEAQDDVGLHELRTELNGEPALAEDVTGQKELSLQETLSSDQYASITPGKMNGVEAKIVDAIGNKTRKQVNQYIRKYDLTKETRLNIGAVYQPDFPLVRAECWANRNPSIGVIDGQYPEWVFERHMDQFSGFGLNRVMIEYNGNEDIAREISRFLNDTNLLDNVEVEPFYAVSKWYWGEDATEPNANLREDVLKPHLDWIRETILNRDNVATFQGRPIIQTWAANRWADDYTRERIMEEWGDYGNFVEDMRSILQVDEHEEPFLVAGTGWYGYGGYSGSNGPDMSKHFDATTTWVGGGAWNLTDPDNFATQEEALDYVEQNFRGNREFVDEHEMEFIPMTFPGFNERGCPNVRPKRRKTPRSTEFFRKTLELADEYRTTELVNIAPYNNWKEGTQIEPGIFMEKNYGTDYLDIIKDFQLPAPQ